jgi:hypothetical protein
VRKQIYQVSPAFRELEPYLEGDLGRDWAVHAGDLVAAGEIASGWFIWALRDAVDLAGYCNSGAKADAYYRRLAQEVNAACDQGLLACGSARKTLAPVFRIEYLGLTAATFQEALGRVISYYRFSADPLESSGDAASLELFRRLSHNQLAPADSSKDLGAGDPPRRELQLLQNLDESKTAILNYIGLFYHYTMPWLFYLALVLYIINGIRIFYGKDAMLFIINSSVIISLVCRLLFLSYLDVTSFKCIYSTVYLAPAFTLVPIFVALSMIDTWKTEGTGKAELEAAAD